MSEFPVWLVVVAITIIAVLTVIATYYLCLLYKQKKRQQNAIELIEKEQAEQKDRINNSIQIIARSVGSDDLTLTEASIRISVLLDGLGVHESIKDEFSAFYQVREAASHIPILDAWKKLDKKEKRRLTKEREALEAQYREFVLDAARRIVGRRF